MPDLLTIVIFGVWIFGMIDVLVTDKAAVRALPKWAWVALVVLFPGVGALGWFLFGRPARASAGVPTSKPDPPPRPAPLRRVRPPTRAARAEEEAELMNRIAERDRLLAQWAEEERRKKENS